MGGKSTFLSNPRLPIVPPQIASDLKVVVLFGPLTNEADKEGFPTTRGFRHLFEELMPDDWAKKIYWANTVRCGTKEPSFQVRECCKHLLLEDLTALHPDVVLLVGSEPLSLFWSGIPYTDARGMLFPIELQDNTWTHAYSIFGPAFVAAGEKYGKNPRFPIWRRDIERFFSILPSLSSPPWVPAVPTPSQIALPTSLIEVQNLYNRLVGRLGLDYETFMMKPYKRDARILTAAFSDGLTHFAFPVSWVGLPGEWGVDALRWILERLPGFIAHNASFELIWTWSQTKRRDFIIDDTAARLPLLHGRKVRANLGDTSRLYLGRNIKEMSETGDLFNVDASQITAHKLENVLYYNGLDAWACKMVDEFQQLDGVHPENYARLQGSIESTTAMEEAGLPIDLDMSADLKKGLMISLDEYARQAAAMPEVIKFEAKYKQQFALSSPRQVGIVLAEFCDIPLPKGKDNPYVCDKQTLQEFEGDHPLVDLRQDFSEADKLRGTYLERVLDGTLLGADGWIHPSYTTYFTSTGRLSCTEPNIQNFPKRKHREVRRQVIAPPGHVLVSFDYGQIEARGLAMVTKDKALRASFLEHKDIHGRWLARALEVYPDYLKVLAKKGGETDKKKILKSGRDTIKTDFVFASFYGSIDKSVAKRTMIPYELAKKLLDEFWAEYWEVKQWVDGSFAFYDTHGYVETLTGLIRSEILPGNEPINSQIQGLAAHLFLDAQNALYQKSKDTGDPYWLPRISIHDDVEFFLPDDSRLGDYVEGIVKVMLKPRYPFQIVPLLVEGKMGPNFADFEEIVKAEGSYYDLDGSLVEQLLYL